MNKKTLTKKEFFSQDLFIIQLTVYDFVKQVANKEIKSDLEDGLLKLIDRHIGLEVVDINDGYVNTSLNDLFTICKGIRLWVHNE